VLIVFYSRTWTMNMVPVFMDLVDWLFCSLVVSGRNIHERPNSEI